MAARRTTALLLAVAALAGCGSSAPEGGADVAVTVTRDFGRTTIAQLETAAATERGALAPLLRRYPNPRATQSLFVNGVAIETPVASLRVRGGDRVWLDQHAAGIAPEVRAVVGSFPEPFLHGVDGERLPARVECDDPDGESCAAVADKLVALGVVAGRSVLGRSAADETVRVLVGPWSRLRGRDAEADGVDAGPRASGIHARFDETARRLVVLDTEGAPARTLGAGTGLVAATRQPVRQPVWFVTGTDKAGVAAAARAFDESVLGDRYALAISRDLPVAVPQP
jgi:hypothetical protein